MSSSSGSYTTVKLLILKDWHFQRLAIYGYLGAAAVALVLVALTADWSFYLGSILLFTVLITLGIHLPMTTIINERKEQTLAFVLSLPVSNKEYTTAKILANLLIILLPWAAITGASLVLLGSRAHLPGGLIPFAALALTEILASSCLLVGVALVSESLGWTISTMVCANLLFQLFLYSVSHISSIARPMTGQHAVWSPAALSILFAEIAAIALVVGLTFFFQSRKTEFI